MHVQRSCTFYRWSGMMIDTKMVAYRQHRKNDSARRPDSELRAYEINNPKK